MITVQLTIYTLRHARHGQFATASHTIKHENKYDVYREITRLIERFADQHGVPASSVNTSSIWLGGDLQ
jgi:hypothetical protein